MLTKLKLEKFATKTSFHQEALYSKSPKEIWQTIHQILNPSTAQIKADPNDLNKHVNTTAERLTNATVKSPNKLKKLVYNLSNSCHRFFEIPKVSIKHIKKRYKKCVK